MNAAQLIARVVEQRRGWADVEPGVRIRFVRPPETDFGRLRVGVTVEHVCEYVDGWEGVNEAVLFGARQGSAEVTVDFDAGLWAVVARDRAQWVAAVANAIAAAVGAHLEAKAATAKN